MVFHTSAPGDVLDKKEKLIFELLNGLSFLKKTLTKDCLPGNNSENLDETVTRQPLRRLARVSSRTYHYPSCPPHSINPHYTHAHKDNIITNVITRLRIYLWSFYGHLTTKTASITVYTFLELTDCSHN